MAGEVVYFGWDPAEYQDFIRRYAAEVKRAYRFVGLKEDFWKSANAIKSAGLVLIWNGRQHHSPLAADVCRRMGIPHAFIEWGFMPQAETFFIDPRGLCNDSILMGDLGWVGADAVNAVAAQRAALQKRHPVKPRGYVLVPLQIENDTSILYTTRYRTMDEFIDDIALMYPGQEVVIRPHPKSTAVRTPRHQLHRIESGGTFMEWAAGASAVVGLTSTSLIESAMLGVPTFALGDCPMRHHSRRQMDRLLAGYWTLRVPRSGSPASILDRFGVRPL